MKPAQTVARRALLSGLAAAPALAALPAVAQSHPDAELLSIAAQHAEAGAKAARLSAAAAQAFEQAEAAWPPHPEALRWQRGDYLMGRLDAVGVPLSPADVARWRDVLERHQANPDAMAHVPTQRERLIRRGREILEARDAYGAQCEAVTVSMGARQLEVEADAASLTHYALEERLFAARATTPAGFAAKARIVLHVLGGESDGTYEDHLIRNLLADVLGQGERTDKA